MQDEIHIRQPRGIRARPRALQHPQPVRRVPKLGIRRHGRTSLAHRVMGGDDHRHLADQANAVLDEVVDNPAWLINEAGNASGYLQAAVEAILEALHKVPGNRVSAETGVAVLRAGIGAVALRLSLLDELADTAKQPAKVAVSAALEAIFDEVFADSVSANNNWDLARNSTLQTLVEIALDKLATFGATEQEIEKLRQAVQELLNQDAPFNPEGFANRLDDLLAKAA